MSRFIFWGTGRVAENVFNLFNKVQAFTRDELVAFVDNDDNKVGEKFKEKEIVSPLIVDEIVFDYLVICCACTNEVLKQIEDESICDINKVWSYEDYTQYIYTKEKYFEKYGEIHRPINDRTNINNKLIVYTAIIGDYDKLYEPECTPDNIEYICFTNNKKMKSNVWDVRYIENESLANVYLARKIKIVPQMFMEINRSVVWVDGKCHIKGDLSEYVDEYQKKSEILCFPHFGRECIVDEAAVLAKIKPDQRKASFIQVAKYLQEGMPLNYGLYETACMVRNMSSPVVRDLMEQWWYEVSHYSYRDQLSLPYIFWKNNYEPDICDQNITNNKWIRFEKHK